MMDVIFGALLELLTPTRLMFMMLGVSVGLVIGVLPGLGGIAGLSLLLPFIYGMDSTSALAMLIGLIAVIPTSDTFSSILMGIPGSSASQATVLDGFPLARQGQGARALSAAFFASMLGGFFGALVLTASVMAARPIILLFGSAELFMLTLFGLSTVAALSGGNLAKGIASACLGLAFGMVGAAPATGEYRMDFDTLYLSDGLPLVIVGLGIFALPELFNLLRGGGAIAQQNPMGTGWIQGIKDVLRNPWLVLRCSGIGALIGAIPGIGGSVVDWIAYSHAMQTSKDASRFGKGEIRGVIAPESANNATQGGALLPTLLFGIPGSGSMAIFLAGMILIGLQPGPAMADRDLGVTYTIIWSLAIANFVGTLLCILLAPGIAKLTTIRYPLIAPFMIMVISFAAFQASRSVYDLIALFAVGILGLFLRRFGWSRPAFLIGFVLSLGAERYLYQAVQFSGWEFLTRPVALIILALTLLSLWAGLRRSQANVNTEGAADESRAASMLPQLAFTAVLLAFFVWVLFEGLKNSYLAALMPVVVATVGGLSVLTVLVFQARGATAAGSTNFDQEAKATDAGPWPFVGWALGFLGLTLLLGFFAALALFFIAFLRVVARCGWAQTLLLTAAACGFILILAHSLNLIFPGGLLQDHYDLPWPLR
ncbi:tripartite tricarboxylate transporter permease [Roseomonas alkaliterrae]|uniref:TctA family transporter n=1 Tax=Neoroseomonas alkaliterrae TaxID=1452450 RepID=A0A840XS72_9PROT|nr:tripartite tricarboxylate transporter permease [Neoroseomonas alkaliterrae]MBB5690776.1 TctA family transporter [Neoroseomonas alkaliterrae]MBR0677687.1 tripartite tricarboxylate transporter permease [Neoroseomonas alkaliterrae]